MTAHGGEYDLFGNPVAPLAPREESRPPVNDMELIEQILSQACSSGFVLIGIREDVYKRITPKDFVEKVPEEIDFAVHQLIDQKWLEIGGSHEVRYERYTGPPRSVLVPRKSRQRSYRWSALQKPHHRNGQSSARTA